MAISIIKLGDKTYKVNKHTIKITRNGNPPAKHNLSSRELECLQNFIRAESSGLRIQSSTIPF